MNYLLATYATDKIIANAGRDITSCFQPPNATSVSYAQPLWDQSLRCSTVYDEVGLRKIFMKGLTKSI